MAKQSFWDHPIDKIEEALNLKKQIHALQAKLSSMFESDSEPEAPVKRGPGRPPKAPSPSAPVPTKSGRKPFSAESKAKMAAAQKARWAAKRAGSGKPAAASVSASSSKPAKKGKRTMSPEVRARLAAAMKARWATAKKKGLPGPNARK